MATLQNFFFLSLVTVLGLFSISATADMGTATFYTPPYTPSSCYGYQAQGVKIAAASDAIWDNKRSCGRTYKVRCLGATNNGDPHPCRGSGTVVVKIVDYCPAGCRGTIDLSQEAFASIANLDAGKIKISYQRM